jgi:hypothetical protein
VRCKFNFFRIAGGLGTIISLVLVSSFSNLIDVFVEVYYKHNLSQQAFDSFLILKLQLVLSTLICAIFLFSITLIFSLGERLVRNIEPIIDITAVKSFFTQDSSFSLPNLHCRLFVFSTLSGLLIHVFYLLVGHGEKKGLLEVFTAIQFLLGGVLLLSAAAITRHSILPASQHRITIAILIIISFFWLAIAGEELSWGQHMIGWNASGVFGDYNFQQETNIHNFFNPLFRFLYPITGIGLFIILKVFWVFPKYKKSNVSCLLLPHPSMYFLVLIIACSSFAGHSETFELLLGVFALLYSTRIFLCLLFTSPKFTFS